MTVSNERCRKVLVYPLLDRQNLIMYIIYMTIATSRLTVPMSHTPRSRAPMRSWGLPRTQLSSTCTPILEETKNRLSAPGELHSCTRVERRTGVGSRLMAGVARAAQDAQAGGIVLNVHVCNDVDKRFYEACRLLLIDGTHGHPRRDRTAHARQLPSYEMCRMF